MLFVVGNGLRYPSNSNKQIRFYPGIDISFFRYFYLNPIILIKQQNPKTQIMQEQTNFKKPYFDDESINSLPLLFSDDSLDLFGFKSGFQNQQILIDNLYCESSVPSQQPSSIEEKQTQSIQFGGFNDDKQAKYKVFEQKSSQVQILLKYSDKIDQQSIDTVHLSAKPKINQVGINQIFHKDKNWKRIFSQERIKGKYPKNTNVPKILVRMYLKHYQNFLTEGSSCAFRNHFVLMKKKLQSFKTNNYKIPDLLELLDVNADQISQLELQNRKTLSKIIGSTLRQEVILNNFVKRNQMSYLLALKLYALRCRSKTLVERVKIL